MIGQTRTNFLKAYEMAKSQDGSLSPAAPRGLIRTTSSLQKVGEADRWFKALVQSGNATAWDWQMQADRQSQRDEHADAGDSYRQAALGSKFLWQNWCHASTEYFLATAQDAALESAPNCIKLTRPRNPEPRLTTGFISASQNAWLTAGGQGFTHSTRTADPGGQFLGLS